MSGVDRPIAPLQNGMLYHAITKPGRGVDIEQIAFDLHEAVDLDRFQKAWDFVVSQHDILRTAFRWEDVAEPVCVVDPSANLPVQIEDWRGQEPSQQDANRQAVLDKDRLQDFDLSVAPLQRLRLVRLSDDHVWGLWTFHHALLDGRSFPLVLKEVFDLYDHGTKPKPRPSFDRFVKHIREFDHESNRDAWQNRLAGVEPATPLRVGVDVVSDGPPWYQAVERDIDVQISDRIRDAAEQSNVSVNNLLQAAWTLLLHRYQSSSDIVFGTTRACRHATAEAKDTIGLLINTVPMRVQVDREVPVRTLCQSIRAQQVELRSIETTPLHQIQQWAGIGPGADLFETLVVYDNASLNQRMASEGCKRTFNYVGQTNYPLTILGYGDESIRLRLEYATSHLSADASRRMIDQLVQILGSMAEDMDQSVGHVDYLTDADHACLAGWNETARDYDLDQTLVDLFERQVQATPDATVLRFGDQSLTYDQFNRRVNQLAHYLRQQGVAPGKVVGVYAFRCIEMLVGIHAIVKAGGAYLPLDPEYPEDRLQFMVGDASAELAIAAGGTAATAGILGCRVIDIDQADAPHHSFPESNPEVLAKPDDVAYVIYTSGSTGLPKGVLNEHRGIVNRLLWHQEAFRIDETDVVLQKTPFTFDVSVWELFWPMQTGASLAIAEPGGHRDTRYLASEIIRCGVTTLHFVPSMLQLFTEEPMLRDCQSIRRVICSGEALARDLQDRFLEQLDVELHNLYGPTEAAIDVTWWVCDPKSPLPFVPIGSAIANTTMHVLDTDMRPAPPGAAGELYIGGVQVSRGYLNRPELNAERFIADPQAGEESRLYRTGDLGRFRHDGSIEYLGRTDHQVKIRGFRIELGEIEVVLSAHPAIAHCVVIDREDRPGDRQIVAYYVVGANSAVTDSDLREFLGQSLADYMIPAAFVQMEQLPLSPSGKVDRKKLPAPEFGRKNNKIELPTSDAERRVAALWCELLNESEVDRSTPFFEAGGHSLLAIRLAARLTQEFDREVSVTDLLDKVTVEAQARLVSSDPSDNARLSAVADAAKSRREAAARRRRSVAGRRTSPPK
tara:strand:+ start:130845 stop:134051 length:3207 start_codon:yes stop_codon:yes gene_type:complete